MEITSDIEKKCAEIIAQYPVKKSAAMIIMHLIQEKYGYFDDDAVKFVAKQLGEEPIDVYGMLTFYPMYSQQPRARSSSGASSPKKSAAPSAKRRASTQSSSSSASATAQRRQTFR